MKGRDTRLGNTGASRGILWLVSAAVLFSVLSGTMVNVALPLIGDDLSIEPARLGWLVTGYLLVFGVSIPFYGRLADLHGARKLFVLGLCVFSVGSILAALAPSYVALLLARLIQATGSAALPGLGIALVSQAYPPERRGSAMGFVSAAAGSGAAVGPTLGGFISGVLGWHFLFIISALAGLLVPVALRILPRGEPNQGEGIDLPGGVLLGLTIGGALLAATEASRGNLLAPLVLVAGSVALVAGMVMILRHRAARFPFVPRDLLQNRPYLALVGLSFGSMAMNLPVLISLPLLLAGHNELSPVQVGLALLPEALVFTALGPISGRVVDRMGPRGPVRAGLLVMIFAGFLLSSFGAGSPVWVVSALAAVLSGGFAFVNSPLTTSVSLVVPRARLASGLSMNSMFFFLGGGLGTAVVGATLTARARAADAFNPLHTGGAAAFSDVYLLLLFPLVIALALSATLPGTSYAPEPKSDASVPQPATGGSE